MSSGYLGLPENGWASLKFNILWNSGPPTLELGRDREDSDFHNKSICRVSPVSDDQCAWASINLQAEAAAAMSLSQENHAKNTLGKWHQEEKETKDFW